MSALGQKQTYAVQNGMSALGQKRTFRSAIAMSALPPKADMCVATRDVRFGPKADISLDHDVHKLKKLGGNAKPKFLCRFHIDDQLELGWLLHGQIRWLSSLEDFVHV
jgi:hypothetical protein